MLDTLFRSKADLARQILGWLALFFAPFGVIGLGFFFKTLFSGGGVTQAWEAAQVQMGLNLLYLGAGCFFIGGVVFLLKSKEKSSQTRPVDPVRKDEEGAIWFQLPNMESVNLSIYSGKELKEKLASQVFDKQDLPKWIELRKTLGRAPFKNDPSYQPARLYLVEKVRNLEGQQDEEQFSGSFIWSKP